MSRNNNKKKTSMQMYESRRKKKRYFGHFQTPSTQLLQKQAHFKRGNNSLLP